MPARTSIRLWLVITDETSRLDLLSSCNRLRTAMQQVQVASGRGLPRTIAPASCLDRAPRPRGGLARDLPETALRTTSRRPIPQPSIAPLTCAVMWAREVLRGVVNQRRIDGKDGVAGSIPAGGSTPRLTSGNAGQLSFENQL